MTSEFSQCDGCPCNTFAPVTRRPGSTEFGVVIDWPSEGESKYDTWLYGKKAGASALLKVMLEEYVDLDEVYVTSALNCRPHPKKKAQQKNAMHLCKDRLVQELVDAGVTKVLCVGPVGFGALMDTKALPAITKVRGKWHKTEHFDVLGTLPTGFAIGAPEYFRDINEDITKFFETDGPAPDPDVEVWWPESVDEAMEAFEFLEEHDFIAADIETTGFSARSDTLTCIGFGVVSKDGMTGVSVVLSEAMLEYEEIWDVLSKYVNDPDIELVWHNAKFDLQFMQTELLRRGYEYDPQGMHDTMLLHYALDERPMGKYKSHGLKVLAQHRFDAPEYEIDMNSFLATWNDTKLPEHIREAMRFDLHKYLGLDVYYTARLFPMLWNECLEEDERLIDQYERIFMPGTIALAQVENHGILLDKPMFEDARIRLAKKSEPILQRIQKTTKDPEFNPGSPQQVKKYVYEQCGMNLEHALKVTTDEVEIEDVSGRKEGIRSRGTYTDPARLKSSATAAPVLKMLARGYPEHRQFLDDVCEWRNYTKNAGTYVNGLLSRVDSDGRIHGTLNIHGTATGRLSSTNPNLQNMPPASHTGIPIRSGFIAPEGYSFIDADYKQLEVRVAAELSGDPVMIEMFESGGDPHGETSKRIYGRSDVSSYERMLGKIITFGLLYGRSPNSIATGAEAEDIVARGGKRWAPEDVRHFFDNLLGDWNVYAKWRQGCRETPYREGEIIYSLGRKRRSHFIPKHDGGHAGRQGINSPCQGTASDFCFNALIRLHEVLKPYDAQVISTVHDSILVECNDEQLEEVAALVEKTMTEDTLWDTRVPLAVDLKISKKWNEDEDAEYGWTSSEDDDELELVA